MNKLTHWMAEHTIFGPRGKIIDGMKEEWCIAKIMRLVGYSENLVHEDYVEEFSTASFLEQNTFTIPGATIERSFITLGTVRQELEKLPGPKMEQGMIEFIESLLVIDHTRRPSASQALQHPYLAPVPPDQPFKTPDAPTSPDKIDMPPRGAPGA